MKKLLLTTLMFTSCACYASVSRGRGDTYTVDSHGAFDLPTNTKQDKIKFVQEIEAHQATSFKSMGPTALY